MNVDEGLLYRQIGERLRRVRGEIGVTQEQLAGAVGVLRTSITNIEAGKQKPPLHLLYKICATLGIEMTSVLPANSDVINTAEELVDVEGLGEPVTPRLAEFLESVRE